MYAMFSYDIPERSKQGNPSHLLRKMGYRINLSVWIIHERNIPRAAKLADKMRENGAEVRIREFSPKEETEIREDALEAVRRDLGELTDSIASRIEKGEAKLAKAQEMQSVDDTNKTIRWVRLHLNMIRRALNASIEASTAFGILADLDEYYEAFGQVIKAATSQWVIEKVVAKPEEKKEVA
jgi:hypothetical protein